VIERRSRLPPGSRKHAKAWTPA